MKQFVVCSVALTVLTLTAVVSVADATTFRVEAPLPQYADLEALAEIELSPIPPTARNLKLTLSLTNASPTNNAEIKLGDYIALIGWDCGEWFLKGDMIRKHFSIPTDAPSTEGPLSDKESQ